MFEPLKPHERLSVRLGLQTMARDMRMGYSGLPLLMMERSYVMENQGVFTPVFANALRWGIKHVVQEHDEQIAARLGMIRDISLV